MYNKVKLTKRQIKEDKFTTFMLTTKEYVQQNWQFFAIGLVVLVLIITGFSYYVSSQSNRTQEAAVRFARALLDYRNGNAQVAILSFSQILDNYGSDDVAEQSTFLLGKLNFESRNYPEAIRYFNLYLSRFKDNNMNRAASLAGIAASNENQGQYAVAAQKYAEAFDEYPDGPLSGDYQYSTMRCFLEAGDLVKAKEHFDRIKELYPGTNLVNRATRMYAEKGQ
jgi:TolA-binding protein